MPSVSAPVVAAGRLGEHTARPRPPRRSGTHLDLQYLMKCLKSPCHNAGGDEELARDSLHASSDRGVVGPCKQYLSVFLGPYHLLVWCLTVFAASFSI